MNELIIEIVNRETNAWNNQDIELLLTLFHPDMVWVWPKDAMSHNPINWETPQGKFDYNRWFSLYQNMFETYELINNVRNIVKVVSTNEGDGGFAVVDIDTIWKNKHNGELMQWKGRTCKTYVQTISGLKMIAQTGVLNY